MYFQFGLTFINLSFACPVFQIPSVMRVINYLKVKATPPKHNWVRNLYALVKKYFVNDDRDEVKMKALMVLHQIYLDFR